MRACGRAAAGRQRRFTVAIAESVALSGHWERTQPVKESVANQGRQKRAERSRKTCGGTNMQAAEWFVADG